MKHRVGDLRMKQHFENKKNGQVDTMVKRLTDVVKIYSTILDASTGIKIGTFNYGNDQCRIPIPKDVEQGDNIIIEIKSA